MSKVPLAPTGNKKAALSQGGQRDAAVNFGAYRSSQRHRAVFTAIVYGFRITVG